MSFRFNLQPMKKPFSLALIIIVLTLVSCSGDTPSPDGGIVNPGGDGTPSSYQLFKELYSEEAAADEGVSIITERLLAQEIVPESMAEYEAAEQVIYDEYYATTGDLDDQLEAGTITDVEYYEGLQKARLLQQEKLMRLDMEWQQRDVWEGFSMIARIANRSDRPRAFRIVFWAGDLYTDEGVVYSSQTVTLPPESDDVYTFRIATGGRYLESFFTGVNLI